MRITLKVFIAVTGILTTGCLPMDHAYQASTTTVGKPTGDTNNSPPARLCKTKDMALFARYSMYIESSSTPAIPYPPAENGSSIMIPYKADARSMALKENYHYLQARHISATGQNDIRIENTATPFGSFSQERRILALKGFENSYLAITGPTSGFFEGYNAPIRLFKFDAANKRFDLLSELNIQDGMASSAQIDILGQQAILMIQSNKNATTRFHFFKLDLSTGVSQEIKTLETTYPNSRVYSKFLKINSNGFVIGLHEEIFIRTLSSGGYFINKFHILRSENNYSFTHEEPFQGPSYRDIALTSDNHENIYKLSNGYNYTRDQNGYLFIDSVVVAERYDGASVIPIELKFAPFQYKSGGFAAQNLLTENNDLYVLARTYDDGNDRIADYQLLKTRDDGATYTQQSITKDNTSALLYYMARTQGSTFVIGNDQQTSETLIYCAQ